jgi:hypothetical protein
MGGALAVDVGGCHRSRHNGLAHMPVCGISGLARILILIPVVNLVLLYFIAFADWPADKASARSG